MSIDSVRAWRLLRMPFVLSEKCMKAHVCEWESIDVDKSGCRLCSHVHECGYGKCRKVVETEDSLVCEITGLCIRKSNIVNNSYSEEVISYGCKAVYTGDSSRQDMYDDIEGFVHELLLSTTAENVCQYEREHYTSKMSHTIQRVINSKSAGNRDAIDVIQMALRINDDRKYYHAYDAEKRKHIADICSQQLRSTIPICNRYLQMNIRRNDMRVVVFGLMFLMRTGICIHDICVLPSITELYQILPNESNLFRNFNFKCKHITDIENKFKFHLRNVTRSHMHTMGFHLVR